MAKKKRKKKNSKAKTSYELYQTIRKDWGEVNPVERVVESKKKYNRNKDKTKLRKEISE